MQAVINPAKEPHAKSSVGLDLRDMILGGQDGLVNVLGVILAVASATNSTKIVLISGLAATFAESISMAAVGYTSSKAAKSFYESEQEREKREMKDVPQIERQEIRDIYYQKGFRGKVLDSIVRHITSNNKLWLKTMMEEELKLNKGEWEKPWRNALVIGIAAVIGSIIPLFPFFFLSVKAGIITVIILSAIVLFISGYLKTKITIGNPVKGGLEMAAIGMFAALAGYGIGAIMGAAFGA